ncbi:hypothetical protein I4U23_026245 [Adineta vaga]|nr:hypothetical protein I4U23_026245 [Adineta vaga]
MFIFVTFLSLLSLSQIHADVTHPTLGPVYVSTNDSSLLNFTIIYPNDFRFDNLFIRFNIYDFVNNEKTNPQIYPFQWANFSNGNTSLPWVTPGAALIPGDYVIGCFQWVRTYQNNSILDDTHDCMLTRAPLNSTIPPIDQMNITASLVTNNTIMVQVYYPQTLPYDMVNITSNINGTLTPTTTNATSNVTFTNIQTFSFTNLMAETYYNVCIYTQYASSIDNTTYRLDTHCQSITTLTATPTLTPTPTPTPTPTSTVNSSYKMISNIMIIISMIIVAFI